MYMYVYMYMYLYYTDRCLSIAFDAQVIFLQMAVNQRDQGHSRTAEQPIIALLRDCMFQAHIVCRVEGLQQSSHDLLQVPRN